MNHNIPSSHNSSASSSSHNSFNSSPNSQNPANSTSWDNLKTVKFNQSSSQAPKPSPERPTIPDSPLDAPDSPVRGIGLKSTANQPQFAPERPSAGSRNRQTASERPFRAPQTAPEALRPDAAPSLSVLTEKESQSLLKSAKIEGDLVKFGKKEELLTPKFLKKHGLGPQYLASLEGTNIGLSPTFNVGGRESVIAYVKTPDGSTNVCSYYRSASQGAWRLLPDYISNPKAETPSLFNKSSADRGPSAIAWYGKGRKAAEESLTLPSELQLALDAISKGPEVELSRHDAELAFAGTAKRYDSQEEYDRARDTGHLSGAYYREVSPTPLINYNQLDWQKNSPETLDITNQTGPNFSSPTGSPYQITGQKFGVATVERFNSQDGGLTYTFCRDNKNRAWLSGIETHAPLTSTGLRKYWISAGDLATPLYEHERMSSGYGDSSDKKGTYVSMWPNYLAKMPLIKRYLSSREKPN